MIKIIKQIIKQKSKKNNVKIESQEKNNCKSKVKKNKVINKT